jgi:hypothetical protein
VVPVGGVELGADEIVGGGLWFFVPDVAQFEFPELEDWPDRLVCGAVDCAWDLPSPLCPLVAPPWCPPPRALVSAPVCDATCEKPAAR